MQLHKINIDELSKEIKEVKKHTTPSEDNNLYSHFSKAKDESETSNAKGNSSKCFIKDLYLLHKQLKMSRDTNSRLGRVFVKKTNLPKKELI